MNIEKLIVIGIGLCCFSYVLTSIVRMLLNHDAKCNGCQCGRGDHKENDIKDNTNTPNK